MVLPKKNHYSLHPFIIGVTSFGKSCGTETPGVYTLVESYVNWIQEVTKENFSIQNCLEKYTDQRTGIFPHTIGFTEDLVEYDHDHLVKLVPGDCLGAIIEENYVLTAASCVSKSKPTLVQFYDKVERIVSKIVIHPNFNNKNFENDLALIEISSPFEFVVRSVPRPACIWTEDIDPLLPLQVVRLGRDKVDFIAVLLKQLDLSKCQKLYQKENISLAQNQRCYANRYFNVVPDTCTLKPGSPLVKISYEMPYTKHNSIFGVTSLGENCGLPTPVLTTKISDYIDWIDSVIFGTPKSCRSPLGEGKCVPSSECLQVVDMVRTGAAISDYACDFTDLSNPAICCAKRPTELDGKSCKNLNFAAKTLL